MGRSKQSETKIDLSLKLDSHDDQEDGYEHDQSHDNQQVQQNIKEPQVDEAQEEHLDDDIESPRISRIQKDLNTQEVRAPVVLLYILDLLKTP